MAVAVYTLRIRDEAGDDRRWQQARVVAGSFAEALVQAQQRFGEDRVMAVSVDATGETPTEADLAAHAAVVVPEPVPDPQIVSPTRAEEIVAAVVDAGDLPPVHPREPMPWEGRWRPRNLLWAGVALGLVGFVFWYHFGAPANERFVTAAPASASGTQGLALGDAGPRGGVLAATGVPLRRGDDAAELGTLVGETMAAAMEEGDGDAVAEAAIDGDLGAEDAEVRQIGTIVGDMFARWPRSEPAPPPPPSPSYPGPGAIAGEPMPSLPAPPREPSVLQSFFVGVDRGGGIIETLRVSAYDADHARAIVSDLPDRPLIVRGPTTRLDW